VSTLTLTRILQETILGTPSQVSCLLALAVFSVLATALWIFFSFRNGKPRDAAICACVGGAMIVFVFGVWALQKSQADRQIQAGITVVEAVMQHPNLVSAADDSCGYTTISVHGPKNILGRQIDTVTATLTLSASQLAKLDSRLSAAGAAADLSKIENAVAKR
jgi:NaMN:DMB phosphoribosyltransferase